MALGRPRRLVSLAMPLLLVGVFVCSFSGFALAETLRLGVTALPIQLGNPYRSAGVPGIFVHNAIFDALTNIDAKGQPQPWLAIDWEAETPTTWVFRLRPGVQFSNGVPFDSSAVMHAIRYLMSPEAVGDLIAEEFKNVADVTARDPHTIAIAVRTPDVLFPRVVSMLSIVEPGAWSRGREQFARQPVGTGPFQIEEWRAGGATFRAFQQSWRKARTDRLEVRALPELNSRIQGLLSGAIDIAMILGPDNRDVIESAGHKLLAYPLGGVMGLAFVTSKQSSPIADVRVRQALNYGVDKERIVALLLGGAGAPSGQPATRSAFGHNDAIAPYPFDPARAKALLAEAGFASGLSLVLEAVPGTIAADAQIFEQVAADLARIGVTLTIRATTFPTFSRHYRQGDWEGDAFGMYYNSDPTLDPFRGIRGHSCLALQPWYCDREIMPTYMNALAATDIETRARLTRDVMARYHEQAASLFLHEVSGFIGLAAPVRDFRIVNNFMHLQDVHLDPRK